MILTSFTKASLCPPGPVIMRSHVGIFLHGGGVLWLLLPHQPDAGRRGAQLRRGIADYTGGKF